MIIVWIILVWLFAGIILGPLVGRWIYRLGRSRPLPAPPDPSDPQTSAPWPLELTDTPALLNELADRSRACIMVILPYGADPPLTVVLRGQVPLVDSMFLRARGLMDREIENRGSQP